MSKVGFWLKGSTGKLAENIQRIVMSTVGAAYSVMKAICDNSLAASGYSFIVAAYSDGNGTGGDPGDVN